MLVLVGDGVADGVVAPEDEPLSLLFCMRVLWSASNKSKSFDLPVTSLLDASECVCNRSSKNDKLTLTMCKENTYTYI